MKDMNTPCKFRFNYNAHIGRIFQFCRCMRYMYFLTLLMLFFVPSLKQSLSLGYDYEAILFDIYLQEAFFSTSIIYINCEVKFC